MSGIKIWKDDDNATNARPDSITVKLLQNGKEYAEQTVNEDSDWTYTFADLDEFDEEGVAYEYTIEEVSVEGYETTYDGFDIINTLVGKTEVVGTKTWLDDNNATGDRPEAITVKLLQNGKSIAEQVVTEETDWTYRFTDLEAFDENGVAYKYTVEEESVENYTAIYDGFNIINVRSGTTEVVGTKTWIDENDEYRPEAITINLYANDKLVDSTEVTAEDNWEFTFTQLPEFDEKGVRINYTIDEVDVPGYEKSIEGFEITNTFTGFNLVLSGSAQKSNLIVDASDDEKNNKNHLLPKTATQKLLFILLGVALITIGLTIQYTKGRKKV